MPDDNLSEELWAFVDAMLNYAKDKGTRGDFSLAALRTISEIAASRPHTDGSEPFKGEHRRTTVPIPWSAVHTIGLAYRQFENQTGTKLTFGQVLGLEGTKRGTRGAVARADDTNHEIVFALAVAKELGAAIASPPRGQIARLIREQASKFGVSESWADKAWAKHARKIRQRVAGKAKPD